MSPFWPFLLRQRHIIDRPHTTYIKHVPSLVAERSNKNTTRPQAPPWVFLPKLVVGTMAHVAVNEVSGEPFAPKDG